MITFKGKVDKIISGLTSVGIVILLMFPASLSADHFRYGTMSWELTGNDNATHKEILLKMENGWTADHNYFNGSYLLNNNGIKLHERASNGDLLITNFTWGDSSTSNLVNKALSRDNTSNNIITEIGDNSSGWVSGVKHSYSGNGPYEISWNSQTREATENMGSSQKWINKTLVNLGGAYNGNNSPVSAVPPVVQVQDNITFRYDLIATDVDSDNVTFRWGTFNEFFQSGSGTYVKPTGMTLSQEGNITWDVRDSVLCNGCSQNDVNDANDLWVAVIMVEDRFDNGSVKSYIPVDFFFKTTAASNDPPAITGIPSGTQTVSVGSTKTFTIKSTDNSGVAPTISVLNLPPALDNSSIWSVTSSTSAGETTFTISFTPSSSLGGNTYVINLRSTDNAGMTKDQSFNIKISSVANADPTAPTLLSPADNSTVSIPFSFSWEKSTDPDGDAVSYKIYLCTDVGFVGGSICAGTNVTAGVNINSPPFNENFHDSLFSWPSHLHAATNSQQISTEHSTIPKLVIMLSVLALLIGIISLSVKNITHRRIVLMLFLIIIGTAVSCSTTEEDPIEEAEEETSSESDSDDSSGSGGGTSGGSGGGTSGASDSNVVTYSNSNLMTVLTYAASGTTFYWKVIALDTNGGSAESSTWNFKVP